MIQGVDSGLTAGGVRLRDIADIRVARGVDGILGELNRYGVLEAADVHVALRLAAFAPVRPADDVLLAIALLVKVVRAGSVCLDVRRMGEVIPSELGDLLTIPTPEAVEQALRDDSLLAAGPPGQLRSLRLADTSNGPLLYFDRYFRQEQSVRAVLAERASSRPEVDPVALNSALDRYFPRKGETVAPDRQRMAVITAITSWTSVIAGGPGTGKTHTVARILAVLGDLCQSPPRVGLCAPTGRAAANLASMISGSSAELGIGYTVAASTVHRLLGPLPGSGNRFRHNRSHRLPYDVVIVDETSMMSLTLMCRLMEALRAQCRLVLVGDPDQLASVEAGAVLADLVDRDAPSSEIDTGIIHPGTAQHELIHADILAPGCADEPALTETDISSFGSGVVRLRCNHRFGGVVAEFAEAVRRGAADEVIDMATSSDDSVTLIPAAGNDPAGHSPEAVLSDYDTDVLEWAHRLVDAAAEGDPASVLDALDSHRVLCAHRDGPWGAAWWSRRIQRLLAEDRETLDSESWYAGQPILVTENNTRAGVFNGDTGVVLAYESAVRAAFRRGSAIIQVHPHRLAGAQPMYALTIHRSQGSQYDTVSVVIPPPESTLLTRELLYTAVTRAKKRVRLIGDVDSLRAGVQRKVLRASGLKTPITEWLGRSVDG